MVELDEEDARRWPGERGVVVLMTQTSGDDVPFFLRCL